MDVIGDMEYQNTHILVWDISPYNPISLAPWDLESVRAVHRLQFRKPGYTSETASRIMVF